MLETLRALEVPDAITPPADARLVHLAATLAGVAVSPRLELYPKGLPAAEALQLSASALAGAAELTTEAEALPDPPALTHLLRAAGLDLQWDAAAGLYRAPKPPGSEPTISVPYLRTQWRTEWDTATPSQREEIDHAAAVERTLTNALRPGSWLVLAVAPEHALDAAERLTARFGLHEFDLDRALLAAMREIAAANDIDWDLVLTTDAEGHPDRPHLEELVREAFEKVNSSIRTRTSPTLLTFPGLLGRFGLTDCLRSTDGPPLWLLAPGRRQEQPHIDNAVIPTLTPAERTWLTSYWLGIRAPHSGAITA